MRRQISYDEFRRTALACVRTLSRDSRPLRDESASAYRAAVGDLLDLPLFAPRFLGSDRRGLVEWNDPTAVPILLRDFAARPELVDPLLRGRATVPPSIQLVLLSCSTCGNKVVIDGFHRCVCLARNRARDVLADVFELSGPAWPRDTPDINVVCSCLNPSRR
jgi:hypothetical protein